MDVKKSIKTALNNILHEGLTDIFPRPFEVDILKSTVFNSKVYSNVKEAIDLSTQDQVISQNKGLQTLKVYPIMHVLYPKKEAFNFRKCALIEPLDTIKYLSLVLLIATDIEKARIRKKDNKVFSYRLKIEDEGKSLFDKEFSFTAFNKFVSETLRKEEVAVLVKCDISNFYDRLNLHRLESILLSVTKKKNVIKLINELLLFWANRDSYGLPVGSNPSRILAETALIDVDKFLLSHKVNFCRYVDDFRLFAPNAKVAHYWLSLLVERLSLEGLFINQSKTFIEDVTDKNKYIKNEDDLLNKTENESQDKLEKEIDEIQELKKIDKKIATVGYSGKVPTRFRNPSEHEIRRLQEKDYTEIINEVENAKILLPDDFREYCKVILFKSYFEKFINLPTILENFPQFTPYVIDLIIKHKDKLPDTIKISLKNTFSKWLIDEGYLPEYIAIEIVRLLSTDGYVNREVLFTYFRSLRRNSGSYIGRSTLESLEKIIERGQVMEIKQYYNRADLWEKRQIVKIVDKHLHNEEKNAWFKNLKMNESGDIFLMATIDEDIKS